MLDPLHAPYVKLPCRHAPLANAHLSHAQEAELMTLTRDFTLRVRGVTGFFTLVSMVSVYRLISTQFAGIPVGKLALPNSSQPNSQP